jgi:exosome complex component RRP45
MVSYATGGGWRQVQLGHTRVLAAVSAELGTPFPDRPTEGALNFLVECPPMGHGGWDVGGKPPDEAVEITRLLERTLRDTGAVDTEALCVLAGRSVRASHPQLFAPSGCVRVTVLRVSGSPLGLP